MFDFRFEFNFDILLANSTTKKVESRRNEPNNQDDDEQKEHCATDADADQRLYIDEIASIRKKKSQQRVVLQINLIVSFRWHNRLGGKSGRP
jgi:uncharacterized FlaG/YvyC family protein